MAKRSRVAGPGRLGSLSAAKKSAKAGGNSLVRTIPSEGSITVRFLEEPPDWYGYYEHFEKSMGGYFPCTGDDCPGCQNPSDDGSRSFRYLANAYVVDDSKVMAVKMPKSLVEQLLKYHEKWGTSLDRDYDLSKSGSGKTGTNYMASPDSPSKMKLSRFSPLDLDEVLESMLLDGEDDDEEPRRKKTKGKASTKRSRDEDDEEDDDPWDDDDDDDDEEEEERPRKKKKATAKTKTVKKPTRTVSKTSKSKSTVRKPSRKTR